MSNSAAETCPRCGAVLPAGEHEALCPACLMSGVLGKPPDVGGPSGVGPGTGHFRIPCKFGEYWLLSLLGRGGMGTVYEAEHLSTGRRVALKMLGEELDSPEMPKRFLREGRLAASVNHPNSLYVFGSEEIEGLPVITMEVDYYIIIANVFYIKLLFILKLSKFIIFITYCYKIKIYSTNFLINFY